MKTGDYIEIKPGVHDERMPPKRRDGLVLEFVGKNRDQVLVLFSNSEILKFHISQVKVFI